MTMTSAFYITARESYGSIWYQLIVRRTHFCISCGTDLDKKLEVLKSYVKDYRTEQRMLDRLERLDCGGRVSPATFSQREDYYQEHKEDYKDLVDSIVRQVLRDALEEDRANSPLRKTRTRLQKAGWQIKACASQTTSPLGERTETKDSPTLLRKPRVFNRK